MAFQPIVDAVLDRVFAYEALVRGPNGEPAASVLSQVDDTNRYVFDQACRVTAVEMASRLGMREHLSINFLPNAVYEPHRCLQTTLAAAKSSNFPVERILFEVSESESSRDISHLKQIFEEYRRQGFATAIDDFGAGHSGLNLLADFQPDFVKLDMQLIRGIDADRPRQVIVRHIMAMCLELGITAIAEGIQTREEYLALRDQGVVLFQGFYFARPAFESLPHWRLAVA